MTNEFRDDIENQYSSKITKEMESLITPIKYTIFNIQFKNWEHDSMHWCSPSNIIVDSDGAWFIYARKLANMRRTGGVFDTGVTNNYGVNMTYKDKNGSVIHSKDYHLARLEYKVEKYNVTKRGIDEIIPTILTKIDSVHWTQYMRK